MDLASEQVRTPAQVPMSTESVELRQVGPTVPLEARCACPSVRRLPVRLASDGLAELRRCLRGKLPPELPVMTYWCRYCKTVVILTARDLYLAD